MWTVIASSGQKYKWSFGLWLRMNMRDMSALENICLTLTLLWQYDTILPVLTVLLYRDSRIQPDLGGNTQEEIE